MTNKFKYTLLILFCAGFGIPKAVSNDFDIFYQQQDTIPADSLKSKTSKIDSLIQAAQPKIDTAARNQPYKPSASPTFQAKDRFGDPFSNSQSPSPLLLKDPSSLKLDVVIDTGMNYTIFEKIGNVLYRPTSTMTFDEFNNYQTDKLLKDYWRNRAASLDGESAVSGRALIPKIYINPAFDKIFGGSYVEINPRGFVTLDFGGKFQRLDDPNTPIRQQRTGGFEFDQQINMNVVGKIGEKLKVSANFDNNNSFDFENNLKVEFTGFEEDIIKKFEIGNVSLPINNSLISGAQNLFGIKTQLQFGKLFVTGVASTQRGKTDVVNIESGGVQAREFDIKSSQYDENKHFFLSHFFRDNYETWLNNIPNIGSGLNITRVEVYVINRNNDTKSQRNVVAFMDLGESRRIYQSDRFIPSGVSQPAHNNVNGLWADLTNSANEAVRDVAQTDEILKNTFEMDKSLHFDRISGARKLDDREFTFHPALGYLSLTRKLRSDEILAVAYEYTYQGQPRKVGELTEDYSNRPEDNVIFLKMLRPSKISIRDREGRSIPTWNLMMKNVYSLNASQVNPEGFEFRVVYRDDRTGLDNPSLPDGVNTRDVPLVELLGLDQLNQSGDRQKDGNFDYVDGITISQDKGQIFFPVLEPFGENLKNLFAPFEQELISRYVYDTLYGTTRADAELDLNKNKFFLVGKLQSGSSSEIMLQGINIAEGSVRVMAGGSPLVEGVDYQVDYAFGRVTILNDGVINSGKRIQVTYEKGDLFSFNSRTMLGTRFDYRLSEDINIGATFLQLSERPLSKRPPIENEPVKNRKYGFDINLRKESIFLTKLIDAIPGIQTKVPSVINFNAEIAQLKPGTSNVVDGEETSYIDDFEASATPSTIGGWTSWKMAATPQTVGNKFDATGGAVNDLTAGFKRANLAWYTVDNAFYRSSGRGTPENITNEDKQNHWVRGVLPQEIFPLQSQDVFTTFEPIFDIAYFPSERGAYNFNTDLAANGTLRNPKENWGGISRAIGTEVDFDRSNVEYIEFWLMDPFISGERGRVKDGLLNTNNTSGGKLIFNLGSVSEDVIQDGQHSFENGLPADGDTLTVNKSIWGHVSSQQWLNNAFPNQGGARDNQDVGLDGLSNENEVAYFANYLSNLPATLNPDARAKIFSDPSGDDFNYFLGEDLDAADIKILERYKQFNSSEGNSPDLTNNTLDYPPSGTTRPDNEDLNGDNSVSALEEYYEYNLDLRPGNLNLDHKYIVDKVVPEGEGFDGDVTWYLFRIPIQRPDKVFGNISGFKTIRFIRTYLTDWSQPVVLRFANFRMVGSQWRRYTQSLQEKRFDEIPESADTELTISVANIEENSQSDENSIPYVLPPGFQRDRDNTSPNFKELNEQSLQICVENLEDKDARAVFKSETFNLINYGSLKMFIHANSINADDDELTAFVRLNTDFEENYYEIEVPLKITPYGSSNPEEIWPRENEINIEFDQLYRLKSRRNTIREQVDYVLPYSEQIGKYKVTVVGQPKLSTINSLMIGVRNPGSPDQETKSACLWVNELRVTDLNRFSGWAANASLNTKLADFANVTASTRYTSFGFGTLQSKITERTTEATMAYDITGNFSLDKFFPEKFALQLPMYASYENLSMKPKYDPLNSDIPLESALNSIEDEAERQEYRNIVRDQTIRRSLNFTNVKKNKSDPQAKSHIYDLENITLSYAYSDVTSSNYKTESYLQRSYKGAVGYNFRPKDLSISPFAKGEIFKSKYLQLVKDLNFNPLPNNISVRWDLDRRFIKTQYRNSDLTTLGVAPNYEKAFTFKRTYNLKWNITKGVTFNYDARANAIVDEAVGDIDSQEERQQIADNLKNLGRLKRFDQDMSINYRLPLDKIPMVNWTNADIKYDVGYSWTSGSSDQIETLGHKIENSRGITGTGKIDFVKLYNKIDYLKQINSPRRRAARPTARSQNDTTTVKKDPKLAKGFLRLLMALRSANGSYSVKEGTLLPGFGMAPLLFGMDSSFAAPGWPFLLGSQNPNIRTTAAANGWLTEGQELTTPFGQSKVVDLKLKATLEPFRDFKIQLDAKKSVMGTYRELFKYDTLSNSHESFNPSRTGSYLISYAIINTAFAKDNQDNSSPTFQEFERNRSIIHSRLKAENTSGTYALNSQDVLIPAFLAAYSGKPASTMNLSPFPKIPIPNWRLDYAGLSKLESLKDIFSSVTISHSYSSTYSVDNFSNSLLYSNNLALNQKIEDYPKASIENENQELVPVYVVNQVMITERFAPLAKISVRTKTRLTAAVEYKTERSLALNLSNSQVTEQNNKDFVFTFGFTKANMKLPFKVQGRTTTLRNDLDFKLDATVRNQKTIQRKFDENDQITNGNLSIQLRPNIGYALNNKLTLQFYFERSVNTPKVTIGNKRATTSFGTQIRFSLAQ